MYSEYVIELSKYDLISIFLRSYAEKSRDQPKYLKKSGCPECQINAHFLLTSFMFKCAEQARCRASVPSAKVRANHFRRHGIRRQRLRLPNSHRVRGSRSPAADRILPLASHRFPALRLSAAKTRAEYTPVSNSRFRSFRFPRPA